MAMQSSSTPPLPPLLGFMRPGTSVPVQLVKPHASPVTHCNPLGGEDRVGFIGVPLSGTDAKIVDEETEQTTLGPGERGVLCVSGPQVMKGYWNMPDETNIALRADGNGAWEEPLHHLRGSVGGYVEVLGLATEKSVADTAAGEIGDVSGLA